jgi:hypothetical protein
VTPAYPVGATDPPYVPCPYSLLDFAPNGEAQPHQAGIWYIDGKRHCAVCQRRFCSTSGHGDLP